MEEEEEEEEDNTGAENEWVYYHHSSVLHISRPEINVTFSPTTRSQQVPQTSH